MVARIGALLLLLGCFSCEKNADAVRLQDSGIKVEVSGFDTIYCGSHAQIYKMRSLLNGALVQFDGVLVAKGVALVVDTALSDLSNREYFRISEPVDSFCFGMSVFVQGRIEYGWLKTGLKPLRALRDNGSLKSCTQTLRDRDDSLGRAFGVIDSERIERLRQSAISGDMDSAAELAVLYPPQNKNHWLTDDERRYWLDVASSSGNQVLFRLLSLLSPYSKDLQRDLLLKIECPKGKNPAFVWNMKRHLSALGYSMEFDSLAWCRESRQKRAWK
ncbi:MAG: hypothetical protein H6686_11530 [Fibrobacteria bacterium]|nr:hypothetical protein [Fibrobacteria bacterium]